MSDWKRSYRFTVHKTLSVKSNSWNFDLLGPCNTDPSLYQVDLQPSGRIHDSISVEELRAIHIC